jgi:carbamoylphosphate synthase large subunit
MNVLITYGWCRTAYAVAENLYKAGYNVFVTDSNRLSMTRYSRYVSGFDLSPDPFLFPEDYVRRLSEIIQKRKIHALIPVHEDSIAIRKFQMLLPPGLMIACPGYEDLLIAIDKLKIVSIAKECAVETPNTVEISSFDDLDKASKELGFPLVIKTRHGNSGKGVFIVNEKDELKIKYEHIVKRFSLENYMPFLQQYVNGNVYGCCFLSHNGDILFSFSERYIRCKDGGFGTSVYREQSNLPLLENHTRKIVKYLNWTGIGHFDYIVSRDKQHAYLIEMNPRFWGAINLSTKNGYDFPNGLLNLFIYKNAKQAKKYCKPSTKPKPSMWIVGEIISAISDFRNGNRFAFLELIQHFSSALNCATFDDFRVSDPLPLIIELVYYAKQFLKDHGNINPIKDEMLR